MKFNVYKPLLTVAFARVVSAEWYVLSKLLGWKREPSWQENLVNKLFTYLLYPVTSAFHNAIVHNLSSTLIIIVTLLILYGIYRGIKGRPSTCNQTNANPNANQTNSARNHINTNVYMAGYTKPFGFLFNDYKYPKIDLAKPPDTFVGKGNVTLWFNRVENYLKDRLPISEWLRPVMTWVSDTILDKIPITDFGEGEEGYYKFKAEMIKTFTETLPPKRYTLNDLVNRTQKPHETIKQYGNELEKIASLLFADIHERNINMRLKETLAQGVRSQRLKEEAYKALFLRGHTHDFTFHQLLDYMLAQETAENEVIRITSNSETETDHKSSFNPNYRFPSKPQNSFNNHRMPPINYHSNKLNVPPPQSYNPPALLAPPPPPRNAYTQPNNNSLSTISSDLNTQTINSIHNDEAKELRGKIKVNGVTISYQYDTGAVRTILSETAYKKIRRNRNHNTQLITYNGPRLVSANKPLEILGVLQVNYLKLGKNIVAKNLTAIVARDLKNNECLLGRDWVQNIPAFASTYTTITNTIANLTNDLEESSSDCFSSDSDENKTDQPRNNTLVISSTKPSHHIENTKPSAKIKPLETIHEATEPQSEPILANHETVLYDSDPMQEFSYNDVVLDSQTTESEEKLISYRLDLENLLHKCSANSLADLKPETHFEDSFQIRLVDPLQKPISCKPRFLPEYVKEKVFNTIQQQMDAKLIRPSRSPWTSPLRVVMKPNRSVRITVDYTALNKVIKVDQYPLPSVTELYNKLSEARFFSKIDLKSAYHQLPVHPDSIEYTAFICEFGTYEYLAMPMGISSAPACFQRFIEKTFQSFIRQNVLRVYLDDLLIFTKSLDEHFDITRHILLTIINKKLCTSKGKSPLLSKKVEFLGQIIEEGEIKPHPKRSECISEMSLPITIFDLQRLLGMTNYCRNYIPRYAHLVKPLYDLMDLKNAPTSAKKKNGAVNGKKVNLLWNDDALKAFSELRAAMSSDLVLTLPQFDKEFILTSDASDVGYGAILEQIHNDQPRIIAFFSRCYTPAQKNYATSEKELLAIVKAVEHWRNYLFGRKFIIYTDHQPLTWLVTKKNPHPRLERWHMQLSLFDYELRYKKGKENIVADTLSRLAHQSDVDDNPDHDYHDILIASIEKETNIERSKEAIDLPVPKTTNENVESIVVNPTSLNQNCYQASLEEQAKDPDIVWIKNLILDNIDNRPLIDTFENTIQRVLYKEYDNLRIIEGVVYRSSEDQNGLERLQFILPKHLVPIVLHKVHTQAYSGHLGRRKTKHILTERFYRPGLSKDIIEYVKTCDTCQKIKVTTSELTAPLIPIELSRTNQLVSTDFTGPFPVTDRNNRYILIIVDCFSKYLRAIPVPNKETSTAAKTILENWCWIFGLPERILSDRGGEFDSMLWDAICNLLDIEKVHTTPYHPQCDGQAEKSVQQVKRMIRSHLDEDQTNWDMGINQLCFTYNSSIHATTKISPFETMFGRGCRIPLDLMFPNVLDINREPNKTESTIQTSQIKENIIVAEGEKIKEIDILPDVTETEIEESFPNGVKTYINQIRENLNRCYTTLRQNRMLNTAKQKELFDRKIKKTAYNIGDWVLCNHPQIKRGMSRGLAPKYHGPFIIVGKYTNGCDYLIRPHNQPKARVKQMHQNNLKIYHKRGHPIDQIKIDPTPNLDVRVPSKRHYNKDPNNIRWKKSNPQPLEPLSSTYDSSDVDEPQPDSSPPKKKRVRQPNKSPKATPIESKNKEYKTRSGRVVKNSKYAP